MALPRASSLIDRQRCQDLSQSEALEWLDTNSAGCYAMGTVAGVRARRYHGLLNGPAQAGGPSFVWLNALEETLQVDGQRYLMHAHQYQGVVTPRGYEHLEEFEYYPVPHWLYRLGEASFTREVFLIEGRPAALVRYCCSEDATLEVRPLLSGRHHHSLLAESAVAPFRTTHQGDLVRLEKGEGSVYFRSDTRDFRVAPDWYYRFEYGIEKARGLDHHEDLWSPGYFRFALPADTWAYLVVSLEDPGALEPMQLLAWREEKERRFPPVKDALSLLANGAKHFLFRRGEAQSVIAGYPWFTDWGRDTFIALPGLLLVQQDHEAAAEVIETFLAHRSHGLIPNRITDDGSTPEYNSIDATLWLFMAVFYWLEAGGDRGRFRREFFPVLQEMLVQLERGTLHAIHCDPADGLLSAGTMETQLTWMDARVYGVPVTPRFGKAVEINALWYNALRLMTDWAREAGDFGAERYFGSLANRTISGFTMYFWNEERGCLYDTIRPGIRDGRVRPNQLFALSLPYPLVVRSKAERILEVVEAELLTPYGLRTLSPQDAQYRGRFEGSPEQRDSAYHQGTVWPWLLGPYVRGALRTRGRGAEEVARCRKLLEPILESLQSGCLGQIPEVYDGDAPQRAGGTPAQAWSLAEIRWLLARELAF